MTEQEIAQKFKDSGINFKSSMAWFKEHPHPNKSGKNVPCGAYMAPLQRDEYCSKKQADIAYKHYCGPWLSSERAESILAEMPFQIVWDELNDCFMVGNLEEYEFKDDGGSDYGFRWVEHDYHNVPYFKDIQRKDRALAINFFFAKYCLNNMKSELEQAIKGPQ